DLLDDAVEQFLRKRLNLANNVADPLLGLMDDAGDRFPKAFVFDFADEGADEADGHRAIGTGDLADQRENAVPVVADELQRDVGGANQRIAGLNDLRYQAWKIGNLQHVTEKIEDAIDRALGQFFRRNAQVLDVEELGKAAFDAFDERTPDQ